ncbi:hypothetical protein BOX15_Mlig020894g5, partial [Macrostomum lignano]
PAAKHSPAMSSGNVAVGEGSASSNSKSSKTSSEQNNSAVQQPGSGRTATTCVLRMRGLPYDATPADVVAFFADCPLRGGESGVHLSRDKAGRPSGEGYAEFESVEAANSGLRLHRQNMGRRYIELFPSSESEMRVTPLREPVLRMRGLPFTADFGAIRDFFEDDRIVKEGILMVYNESGKPSGEAYVQFGSPEAAARAMAKHNRQNMGHRYIELFPSSMAEAYAEGNRQRCMRQAYQHGGYGGYGDFYPPHQPGGPGQHPGFHPGRGGARGVGGLGARGGRGAGPGFGYGAGRGGHPGGRWQPQHHPPGGGYSYPPPPFPQHPQQRNFNYHPHGGVPGGGFHGQFYQQPHGYPRQFHRLPHQQHQQKNYRPGSNWQSSTGHWVHLRGLPFSVTVAEVTDFFAPLKPSRVQLHFNRAGRPNGEADVDFGSAQEAEEAMKRDKAHIGSRYIDLFLHPDKADAAKRQNGVRLRGLPDGVTEADIKQFFQPSVPARICLQAGGEAEAFFDSAEDQQRAITLSGEKIGERCINVFLR